VEVEEVEADLYGFNVIDMYICIRYTKTCIVTTVVFTELEVYLVYIY